MPYLRLSLDTNYLIIETDGCKTGWRAVLLSKPHRYASKNEEQICRYSSSKYKEKGPTSSIDQEILAVCYGLDSFRLFILDKKEILVRTNCEAIVKFYSNRDKKKISYKRLTNFLDRIMNKNYHITFEHIKEKDNYLADQLSRLLNG